MSKPTEEELATALKKAAEMKEKGEDPDFIAKSLLNLHYRIGYLEKVYKQAEHYLRFGQMERDHTLLVKAIDVASTEERHINKIDPPEAGI